jgi:DNA processing protein
VWNCWRAHAGHGRQPQRQRAGQGECAGLCRGLSGAGLCIVSGLALGIDAAAHEGALRGHGSTVAVIGTGPDLVYPARNRACANASPRKAASSANTRSARLRCRAISRKRNRIISGLAAGVLVVEAAAQSGSLITARQAAEQGRDVFAIPGSIHAALAKGCHILIREGAKLVDTAADVLEAMAWSPLVRGASGKRRRVRRSKIPTAASPAGRARPRPGRARYPACIVGHEPRIIEQPIAGARARRTARTPARWQGAKSGEVSREADKADKQR